MIHIVCLSCGFGLRVSPGVDDEVEGVIGPEDPWYPDRYPCQQCGELAGIVPNIDGGVFSKLNLIDVSPFEALAALNGLGLPQERECSPSAVENTLTGARIRRVATRVIKNSHRSVLEFIELEDGTRVYLASSTFGATVYRISPKGSYVEALRGS